MTAVVNVPESALAEDENECIALPCMIKMNGSRIELVSEGDYRGDCGIDWEKYDFVTPLTLPGGEEDAYSWKKEWLKFDTEEVELTMDPHEMHLDIDEIEEAISEKISAATGFCHKGFTWEIKVTAKLDTSD